MKVILKEDVKDLGIMGTVVDVANGYGRNYLIPRKLAVEANPKNMIARVEQYENSLIEKALKKADYNKTEAARILGIKTSTLYYKMEKYNL